MSGWTCSEMLCAAAVEDRDKFLCLATSSPVQLGGYAPEFDRSSNQGKQLSFFNDYQIINTS